MTITNEHEHETPLIHETYQPAPSDHDLLPVVDARDNLVDILPRRRVHLEGLRHRAVHVGIVDPCDRVWLQLRSRAKDSWPGHWDLSVTGHVDPGESYESAVRRELREEIGLDADPAFVTKIEACELTGWEFQSLYALRWAGDLDRFNPDEIESMRPFTLDEIREMARGASPLGCPTPCVIPQLPAILRALGIAPAVLE